MVIYGPLAEVAVIATIGIVVGATALKRRPVLINGLLLFSISTAMCVYAFLMSRSLLDLPFFLFDIVTEPGITRKCLLAFWGVNVLASVAFGTLVSLQGNSSTIHRKFFHLTVSCIYLAGLFIDKNFVWLCGWLSLCIFVIVEVLRFYEVPPWSEPLNNYLLVFKDAQDSAILFTPIYLLGGIFLPLFLSPNEPLPKMFHLAGVAAVGVGDSLAAIVGSTLGRTMWPGRRKTVEGSLAMVVGIVLFLLAARPFCASPEPSVGFCVLVAVVLSVIEAFVTNVDNILLPLVGYFML